MGHVGEKLRLVPVGGFDLAALVLDLSEQPGVLDRQNGLRREGLQADSPPRGETPGLVSPDRQAPMICLLAKKRHGE